MNYFLMMRKVVQKVLEEDLPYDWVSFFEMNVET